MQESFPLFRDYTLAVRDWLRNTFLLPRVNNEKYDITKIVLNGTAGGGVNQHEIHLTTNKHNIRTGHAIRLIGTTANDEYYMVLKNIDNIIIIDINYKKLAANQLVAGGKLCMTLNVIYAGMDKAVAQIAQPLRNGMINVPGVGFYLSNHEMMKERTRPKESYYTRRWKDEFGNVVKTAAVPPMIPYKLNYSINLYHVYQQEMDIMLYQLASEFNPEKWFWIGDPNYGLNFTGKREERELKGQWAHVELESITDVSEIETGSPNRTLRTEVAIAIEALLPIPFDNEQSFIGAIDIDMIADLSKPIL